MLVKKKSRRLRKFFSALFFTLLVGGAIYAVWYSPVFVIQEVSLRGADFSREELNDMLGGDPTGQNILFWRMGEGRTLDPRFAQLEVTRNYLKRSITIEVVERTKSIVWCFEIDNSCYWVDPSGFIFSPAPSARGAVLTVVTDSREFPPGIGEYVLTSAMNEVLYKILGVIERTGINVVEIRLKNIKLRELLVTVSGGPQIIFSLSEDPAFTETAIKSLIDSGDWGKIKSLNLTVPGRAYPSY